MTPIRFAAIALTLSAAPARAQEPPPPGDAPPVSLRGHHLETRRSLYHGKQALIGMDVTSPDWRPEQPIAGKKSSGATAVDPAELRARTLALYDGKRVDHFPEPVRADVTRATAVAAVAAEAPGSPTLKIVAVVALVATALGAWLTRR